MDILIKESFIDDKIISANQFLYKGMVGYHENGQMYRFNRVYTEYKERLKTSIKEKVGYPSESEKAYNKTNYRKLVIIRVNSKLLDKDNLILGTKPIVDILKKMKWIYDDDPTSITTRIEQIRCQDEQFYGTIIQIWQMDQAPEIQIITDQLKEKILKLKYGMVVEQERSSSIIIHKKNNRSNCHRYYIEQNI